MASSSLSSCTVGIPARRYAGPPISGELLKSFSGTSARMHTAFRFAIAAVAHLGWMQREEMMRLHRGHPMLPRA